MKVVFDEDRDQEETMSDFEDQTAPTPKKAGRSNGKALSRRDFLRLSGGFTVASLLAACAAPGGGTTSTEEGGAGEPVAREPQEITLLIRTDIRSAYAADPAVERWNEEFEDQITLEEPADTPDTKIQAAQAAGDLIWDAFAVIEFPWRSLEWYNRGLMQPYDPYIEASTVPDADKVVPGIIPSIFETLKVEGQQYAIPGNVGSVALGWFWEPLRKAGFESQPMTWDEVRLAAEKIRETSPELTPFDAACTPLCDLYAMIWGATENPLTDDGLVDIGGEAGLAALAWLREMAVDGLLPPATGDNFQDWLKGGTAMMTSYDVHGTMAQQTFGEDAATTGINFFREDPETNGTKAGTPFWINGVVLLNDAPNPQGAADFILWWFGPSNEETGRQITEVAAKPCYQYTYDQFVKDNPTHQWQLKGIELVRDSVWFPTNLFWQIQTSNTEPQMQSLRDPSQDVTPEQVVENAMAGIQADIAELKESGVYEKYLATCECA